MLSVAWARRPPAADGTTTPMHLTIEARLNAVAARFQQMGQQIASSDTMRLGYVRAGAAYLAFIRKRYLSAARGDGTWPDLADSTKLSRMRRGRTKKLNTKEKRNLITSKKRSGRPVSSSERTLQKQLKAAEKQKGVRAGKRVEGLKIRIKAVQKRSPTGTFEILRDTGIGFNSLSQGGQGNVMELLPDGVLVGTNVKYMKHHQDPEVSGRPPQRKFLVPPDSETRARIRQLLQSAVSATAREMRQQ